VTTALAPIDEQTARQIVDDGIRRYVASRRALIPEFVRGIFGLRGSLRLHRRALGFDLVRAPYNVLASIATVGKNGIATGLRAAGQADKASALRRRSLFLRTRVGREIEWRLHTDFLELPYRDGDRASEKDALVETILQDPRVAKRFEVLLRELAERAEDAELERRVTDAMAEYLGSRSAAADVTSGLMAAAVGVTAYHQFTPGVAALSGAIAGSIAKSSAVSSFALGSWLGSVYYSIFSTSASPLLYAGVFAGLMVPMAMLTAFAGVVADPVQTRLGLHQRRLNRMLDVLERNMLGDTSAAFQVRDHYVARIMDVMDWTATLLRVIRT